MNTPASSPVRSLRLLAGIATVFCAGAIMTAQQTSSGQPTPNEESEIVLLSPFEVSASADVGYVAASSLAGGRTDTPLKDTPSSISVFTREFLDDLAMTGMRDMTEWTVNATPKYDTSNTFTNQAYELNIRGLGSSFPSRNYFVWYVNSDSFATERLEFARGPNGVLFGDGGVGGLVTTYSKRPILQKNRTVIGLRADTDGGYRATLDWNLPIGKKAALRLNLLEEEGEHWVDRLKWPRRGAQLSGALRLTRNTTLRTEGEWGRYKRNNVAMTYSEQLSYWTDPSLIYDGTSTLPTGALVGVANMGANTYVPALPELGIANWGARYRTMGSDYSILPDSPRTDIPNSPVLPSREFNIGSPASMNQYTYWTTTLYLDHKFGENLYVQLAYNHLDNESEDFGGRTLFNQIFLDLNRVLPNGENNPKFLTPYSEIIPWNNTQGNSVNDIRLLATYKIEAPWMRQRFSLIAGSRSDHYDSLNKHPYISDDPHDRSRQLRVRLYADEPGHYSTADLPDEVNYFESGGYKERKTLEYAQLASTSQFFNDRLTLHLGMRRDHLDRWAQSVSGVDADGNIRWGASILTPSPTGDKAIWTHNAKDETDVWVTSYNAGAVWFVLPWLGVYANYSETFAPPTSGANRLDGRPPGFSRSEGNDYGIKIHLPNGKLSATINYYDTTEKNKEGGNNTAITQIRSLWINSDRSDLSGMEYRDSQDVNGKGWEFEVTANPTRNLRLTFNAALPETESVNLQQGLRWYYYENLPIWQSYEQQYRDGGQTGKADEMKQNMETIASTLSSLTPGVPLNHTPDYTANFYGTYTFYNGPLKNFAFGLGANIRGKAKIGSKLDDAYDYYYSDSYYLLSGHIAWQKKVGKVTLRFQLNVSNILDNDDIIFMTYKDYTPRGGSALVRLPFQYRYLDPRRFIFSTTISF